MEDCNGFWKTQLNILSLAFLISSLPQTSCSYEMYVWRTGWDPSVPGCSDNPVEFLKWNESSPCFTHTWNTSEKREWLWSTCTREGRQISKIFLYDTKSALATRNCTNPGVQLIQETMAEGHRRVPGLQIYALFSDGGDNVPESSHVLDVVWYNTHCAGQPGSRIDGVAVNNENWKKEWSRVQMRTYLDNLNKIKMNANQQFPPGELKTHFSVGWHWGRNSDGEDIILQWNEKTQPVMRHFVDIFDSLDVQVAFITPDAMEERLLVAEWDYSVQQGKPMLATIYINWALPCQTTFFPFAETEMDCPPWTYNYKNESQMFEQLDAFQNAVRGSRVALHYFRGAYSSDGGPGWPKH